MKSDRQIVDDCNALAREFYGMFGCQVPEGYRFDAATHPQEQSMWNLAVAAYYHIEGTDVEEALAAMEEAE